MSNNFWMGGEELTIVYMNGTHAVLSNWEDEPLFTGSYNACREYCLTREVEYLESII